MVEMEKKPWHEFVALEDLSDDLQIIAETVGLPEAIRLAEQCGGCRLSIPKNGLQIAVTKWMRREYNGRNLRRIAMAAGVSERKALEIIQAKEEGE